MNDEDKIGLDDVEDDEEDYVLDLKELDPKKVNSALILLSALLLAFAIAMLYNHYWG